MKMKRGQIWIETVIYTLIGLSLIAIVLAIVTPKINEQRDRAVIEQTISSLNALDSKVREVTSAPGNVRIVEFNMKRGNLHINGSGDSIHFELSDSRTLFSEPGVPVQIGRVSVLTTQGVNRHAVRLTLDYDFNMTYSNSDVVESLSASSIPYIISIENRGFVEETLHIDLRRS